MRSCHLLLLAACTGKDPVPRAPAGSDGTTDTNLSGDGDDGTDGTDGSDGGDSADTAIPWLILPDSCEPPVPSGVDGFTLRGSVKNTETTPGSWFTEILDLVHQPTLDRVLTVGQGGLAIHDVSDRANPRTRGHVGSGPPGFIRYYHLLPLATW